jgi:hypothetical protein
MIKNFLVVLFLFSCAHSGQKSAEYAKSLVAWDTPESHQRFARADKVDFFKLANHFEAQINKFYCGPASAVIVLNALRARNSKFEKPEDMRLFIGDKKYLPSSTFVPVYRRYTQDQFINDKAQVVKTRSQVFGEEKDYGYQLDQYAKALQAHDLKVTLHIVDDLLSDSQVKKDLIQNLNTPNDFVLVNYSRKIIEQGTGGHISPLGAYDSKSDSFLIMDVTAAQHDWVWVNALDLIAAMRTFDTVKNRGYVLISEQ